MEAGPEPVAAEGGAANEHNKKMTVLVAVDDSEGSLYALSWALDNLFTPGGAAHASGKTAALGRLILLHAQQPLQHFMHPNLYSYLLSLLDNNQYITAVYATSSVIDSVRKAQEQNSRNLLQRAAQICTSKLVKAETVIVDGDPKDVICHVAEELQADLLVVGSRGLSKIRRIGGIAEANR
ncbi:hypothetical protein Cni_G07902 [Canna indica]|uniref:UspA domain-containing protein n=1 Tax=Canna indica TaxID=4628 RepID=A0AAQ3Q7D4_9LILI|nr:hypothetical protein Cni_G07902 [Canna indica]